MHMVMFDLGGGHSQACAMHAVPFPLLHTFALTQQDVPLRLSGLTSVL